MQLCDHVAVYATLQLCSRPQSWTMRLCRFSLFLHSFIHSFVNSFIGCEVQRTLAEVSSLLTLCGFRQQIQVIRFGCKCLCSPNHLTGPRFSRILKIFPSDTQGSQQLLSLHEIFLFLMETGIHPGRHVTSHECQS